MKKIYKIIIIILLLLGFYYIEVSILDEDIMEELVLSINNSENKKHIFQDIEKLMYNKELNNVVSLLNEKDKALLINKKFNKDNLPLVYIYNTHDKENYSNKELDNYNIEANVKTASYILQEQLKKLNISSIVEERSPTSYAQKNNLDYPYSYRYSKEFTLENMKKYPSLKYFIDIHRDGVNREISTIEIDNKSYAKLMFVVGLEHDNSNSNLELAKKIENNMAIDILRKTYLNNNDTYNQDINNNCLLIEVGGKYNSLDEVYNSLVILAEALSKTVRGENE